MSHAFFETVLLHLYCKCENHFLSGRVPDKTYFAVHKCASVASSPEGRLLQLCGNSSSA